MTARRWSCSSGAGITGDEVGYIEAHGTATELGDPIEVAALTRAFGETSSKQFVPIGSVKTNVGHLDRAAGVTGLIKTSLALWNGVIPPSLHYTAPNPQIDFENSPFYVNTELSPWRDNAGKPPIAGINSLGMGGTNVHLVVEQAPVREPVVIENPDTARRYQVLPLSARNATAADQAAGRLGDHLLAAPDTPLADVAYTLQVGRKTFEHRRVLVVDRAEAACEALTGAKTGLLSRVETTTGRPVAFLFAGVGEQYPGMVAELYRREPVFRAELDACLAKLDLPDVDLVDLLTGDRAATDGLAAMLGRADAASDPRSSALERTGVVQPALFAVEYALARTLMAWGLKPQLMMGYSLGEYVAACVAGVLSPDDALKLVAHRARLIDTVDAGSMVAVSLPERDLGRYGLADRGLDIAAVNGPQVTVVAGPGDAMEGLLAELRDADIPFRALRTTHAFHSRMLEPLGDELTAWVAANVTLNAPTIPYISNVTGLRVTTEQATNPAYWARHMCRTVQFATGVDTLLADPELAVVEIGPGQSLGTMVRGVNCPPSRWPLILATLPNAADRRADDEALADCLARLWLGGVDLDWTAHHDGRRNRIPLPTYPFQRQRYWIEPSTRPALPAATPAAEPVATAHVQVMRPEWTVARITGTPAEVARCVLYSDTAGVADALAGLLRTDGVDVVVVPAKAFTTEEHAELVREHAAGSTTVVDLRLLDHPVSDGRDVVLPTAAVLDAWGSDGNGSARVIVATKTGQAVAAGDVPEPGQSAAAVLQLVANLEYLNLDCCTVDVDASADVTATAGALAAEVRRPEDVGDVLMAYRDGVRHVRGYAPAEPDPEAPAEFAIRTGGTYLITGGLGDLGLLLAEHFARAGAARLVLTSRNGLPAAGDHSAEGDQRTDGVARIRELGAEVLTPAIDVTDLDAMRALVADVVAGGRLDGVVHAAAVTDPGTFRALREVDDEVLDLHFGAKVAGARVVETVLAELPEAQAPEFCLLFSSTSSILGGITFAAYAAANAALAAIGYRNHSRFRAGEQPTCWISSSWDTWTVTLGHVQVGAAMSKHSMTAEEALAAFDRLLAAPRPWLVVAAGGLEERLPRTMTVSEALSTGPRFPRPDLPQPYTPPSTPTERALAELWSRLVGVEPVGVDDPFFDLGGNSLLGLQMLSLVKKRFGIAIAAVTLFEAPTVQGLAAILDNEGATDSAAATVTVTERPQVGTDDDHKIAIVGMAGRFPGAPDVESFWRNLRGGVETISFFSEEELLGSGVTPEELANPSYVRARPVLDNVAGFDAAFFGMSPRAASITDPQQRLFLEVCWEALEQSGYVVPEHRGRVGVYGGANLSTYLMRMPEKLADGEFSTYEVIMGNDKDALTLTVSYLLDLYGPSVAVQTFCSTSLVATHMAIRALRNGDCEMALAGGVSVRVPDKIGHEYAPGGMESPDGHVRTFDAQAAGSMFGDGAAVVVLKR
ncbi:type I polyketide synthase [Saccharothrix sp. NRRL B-16314]|uniref:type I polyketide synthase n=1 Tax=Saccharothrix sp. NRRL B-16314 TaxID=1463825 RepID=UPI0006898DE0|nr:type I polyketide synthase [Saccharothrix sp. NRRL B-16314]